MSLMKRRAATLLLALTLAGAAVAAGGPVARVPHANKPPFPQLTLPDRQSAGQRAIDLLGDRLPEVAAWYGQSADEFKARLLKDRTLRLDRRGRLFVVEEQDGPPLPATPAPGAAESLLDGNLLPLDQTFFLHSRPGAKRTIYLNFRGATITGTGWNDSTGVATINAPPFDLDGIPGTFNTTELQRIQYIWQRVSEDYSPFDVNVTTEPPPVELINRSGSADDVFGTTVLITNRTGVYSCSCGGVAYVGVFDDTSTYYKPALVFYDALTSGNEKNVAEAISHEAGHNMGLGHDGTATASYYTGQGTGVTAWAPIMGVGYSKPLVQWSKGDYTSASNLQDDYAVMQSNGLPLRADDHGNTAGSATVLGGTSSGGVTTVQATGVIGQPVDVDVFAFSAAAGTASFTVGPAARSANLDAWVGLRDAAGNLLANINPADALNASFSVNLPATGTYTLSVQGTGKGDPLVDGYSNYGSLGQYAVSGSFLSPGNLAPTAVVSASTLRGTAPLTVNFSGASSTDTDGSLVAHDWAFSEGGTASGLTTSRTYSAPGSYTTQLRVTDNGGLSATSSVTVTVDAPVVIVAMRVADIAMARTVAKNGTAQATAAVKVLDASLPTGLPVAGATVTGTWSGLVSRSGTATTDASGVARFSSPTTRATSGSFTFTVTGVSRSGYSYVPLTNTETRDSIAR